MIIIMVIYSKLLMISLKLTSFATKVSKLLFLSSFILKLLVAEDAPLVAFAEGSGTGNRNGRGSWNRMVYGDLNSPGGI